MFFTFPTNLFLCNCIILYYEYLISIIQRKVAWERSQFAIRPHIVPLFYLSKIDTVFLILFCTIKRIYLFIYFIYVRFKEMSQTKKTHGILTSPSTTPLLTNWKYIRLMSREIYKAIDLMDAKGSPCIHGNLTGIISSTEIVLRARKVLFEYVTYITRTF